MVRVQALDMHAAVLLQPRVHDIILYHQAAICQELPAAAVSLSAAGCSIVVLPQTGYLAYCFVMLLLLCFFDDALCIL
jgi:hypothetical protein